MESMPPGKVGLIAGFVLAFIFLIVFSGLFTLRIRQRKKEAEAEKERQRKQEAEEYRNIDSGVDTGCSWCYIAEGGKCRWCREADEGVLEGEFKEEGMKDKGKQNFFSSNTAATSTDAGLNKARMEAYHMTGAAPTITSSPTIVASEHPLSRGSSSHRPRTSNASTLRSSSPNGQFKVVTGISIMHPGSAPPSPDIFLGLRALGSRNGSTQRLGSAGECSALGGVDMDVSLARLDSGIGGDGMMSGLGVAADDSKVKEPPRVVVKHSFKAGKGLYEQSIEQV